MQIEKSGTQRMDLASGTKVKQETRVSGETEKMPEREPGETNTQAVDFNKLYGDLYRKLINTPVKDIFPQIPSTASVISPVQTTGSPLISPLPTMLYPSFPAFGAYPLPTNVLGKGITSANGLGLPSPDSEKDARKLRKDIKETSPTHLNVPSFDQSQANIQDTVDSIYAEQMKGIDENMDVQKLVEEFRVTLEKFGVSQRFAARFIMQDTSQGNLSFLMEKGKNRKWADLSPRGRIPYIRMKAWLESTEQQQYTLSMLKHSQDMKKTSPRESYSRRERFSMFQIHVLCRLFEENPNPPMNIRNAVAERLNIPLDRVNVWFQNQRARGFPARKFLDQNFQEDMQDPLLSLTPQSSRKHPRRQSEDSISNGGTNSYDFDSLHNHRGVPIDVAMATTHAQMTMFNDTKGHHISTPIKTEWSKVSMENETDEPLDFTTSKCSGKSFTASSSSSSVSIGALSNIVNNMTPSSRTPAQTSGIPYEQDSGKNKALSPDRYITDKRTSGAAKRKRGMKPQQIIYRPVDDNLMFENGNSNATKQETNFDKQRGMSPKRFKADTNDIAQENVKDDRNGEYSGTGEYFGGSNNAQQMESGHGLSAEATVALVQTLYKKQLQDKSKHCDITEPDLD